MAEGNGQQNQGGGDPPATAKKAAKKGKKYRTIQKFTWCGTEYDSGAEFIPGNAGTARDLLRRKLIAEK